MVQLDTHWFEEFFDSAYQYTWILDAHGKVVRANRAALKLIGSSQEDVTGVAMWEVPWPALSRQNRRALRRAVDQAALGKSVRHELEIVQRGQPKTILSFSLKPLLNNNGGPEFMVAEGRDLTTYKHTTEALYQSEARFKTIFKQTGIGIIIKGIDEKILDCNPAIQSILGYTREEFLQRTYLDITHPLDKGMSRKLFNELVAGKRNSYIMEKHYFRKDGQVIWGRVTSSLVLGPDGQAQFVIAMVEDITAQKQIESELNELQQRLMRGREMERLRMAQDLHDGPLQEIIGVSYQFQALKNAITEESDREQLQTIQDALQQLTKSIRSICGELRPPTLIPFGLEKALLSHAEDFQNSHPEIKIEQSLAKDGQTLSEQVRIVLFRIYQEALNNVLRHAQASLVRVRFWMDEEQAILEIQDDGVGFELPNRWIRLARQGHLGLVGAMERAREVGGSLEITSAPGQGTTIRATVPIQAETLQDQVPGERNKS